MPDENPKFRQIYFADDEKEKVNTRCDYNDIEEQSVNREILSWLEIFLMKNPVSKIFKYMSNRLQNDNYMDVIKLNNVPVW